MPKAGRPKLALDENLIYSLASKGCSDSEIRTIIEKYEGQKVSMDVLLKKRSQTIEQGRADMRRSLREAQIAMTQGEKPNPIMMIWLGKQYLGQADKVEANNKQVLQITSAEIWQSAFGTVGGRAVQVPKGVAKGTDSPEAVH